MFTWKEEYRTGIEKIDEQHMKMFEIGRKIEAVIGTYDGSDIQDQLNHVYGELRSYTQMHFKYEESLMEKANYVGYEAHVKKHEDLVDKISNINISDLTEQGSTAFSILQLVAEWIYEHIQGDDFSYINDINRYLDSNK